MERHIFPASVKYAAAFIFGGLGYGCLELLFRGRTHWSMLLAGGVCSVFLDDIAVRSMEPVWKKCLMGGAVITTVEFITGTVVNILLGWNVWNYANRIGNLMGQICIAFSALWVFLSAPAMWVFSAADNLLFGGGNNNRRVDARDESRRDRTAR